MPIPANSYLSDAILQRDLDLVRFTLESIGTDYSQEKAFEIVKAYGEHQHKLINQFNHEVQETEG